MSIVESFVGFGLDFY